MVVEPLQSVADILADLEPGLPPAGEAEEEELEWISNRDSFPPVETFVAEPEPDRRSSPVSVLPFPAKPPARARSKVRQRKRRVFFSVPADTPAVANRRRCLHCESETTPQWRAGPSGPKTLCNACGVRYKSGRLVPEYRPANSPSFSAALHSNSHRKIMEMRRRTGSGAGSGRRGPARLVFYLVLLVCVILVEES